MSNCCARLLIVFGWSCYHWHSWLPPFLKNQRERNFSFSDWACNSDRQLIGCYKCIFMCRVFQTASANGLIAGIQVSQTLHSLFVLVLLHHLTIHLPFLLSFLLRLLYFIQQTPVNVAASVMNPFFVGRLRYLSSFVYLSFNTIFMAITSRDSSVGMATRYGMDGPEIESRWGRDFPQPSRPALGPTQPPIR